MPEAGGQVAATRVAYLELGEERRLVQEGYELLDEKRMLLASEIMRQLAGYRELRAGLEAQERAAREALEAATGAYGFEDLTVQPPASLEARLLHVDGRPFLGLTLFEAVLGESAAPAQAAGQLREPLPPYPEARGCAIAFQDLVAGYTRLAACAGNLRRLVREYTRTERRARALENVVLPEIDLDLRYIEEQLDLVDQEEAVRVRNAAGEAGRGRF
jgi:V/A-type H+-transporting ATPase subunit D